jgi:toxin ParE1/3/4
MKVRYRQRALADIENIYDYLNERNPRAATEIVARIRSAADRLGEWPRIGHLGRAASTYEWVVVGSPYVIVYELNEAADELAVIAVFHGAQDRDKP